MWGPLRYVNRRTLLIVAVLAALVSVAEPHVISIVSVLNHVDMRNKERSRNIGEHSRLFMLLESRGQTQEVLTSFHLGVPSDAQWGWLMSEHDNLIPSRIREIQQRDLMGEFSIYQFGWPFRAAYYCVFVGDVRSGTSGRILTDVTTTYSALEWGSIGWTWLDGYSSSRSPACFPLGVRWAGLAGNVGVSVLFFGALYCGLANLRARRRIRRGQCWRCGYLSKGAAVCPECGVRA